MQSKNTHYNQRKRLENEFTKYKDLDKENTIVNLILGKAIHRADITFSDGNRIRWSLRTTGEDISVIKPRLWEYTMEKLAVLDWLTDTIFSNSSYTIKEDTELHQYNTSILKYKIKGEIRTPDVMIYSLATETFNTDDFLGYGVKIISKVAKTYKFPTHKV